MVRSPSVRPSLRAVLTLLAMLVAAVAVPGSGTAVQAADEPTGVIQGTVAYPANGPVTGLGGVDLHRWVPDPAAEAGGAFEFVDFAPVTQDAPAYSFGAQPPGTYYLVFIDDEGNYWDTYSGGATQPPAKPGDPGAAELAAGETLTLDVHPRAKGWGSLVGEVVEVLPEDDPRAGERVPVPDIEVVASSGVEEFSAAPSDAEGRYDIPAPDGTYTLTFTDPTGVFRDAELRGLEVVAGEPTTVETVALTRSTTETVSGRVLGQSGTPVPATVTLWQVTGTGTSLEAIEFGEPFTATDGTYQFADVPTGQRYTVSAKAPGYRETFLGGVPDVADATVVELRDALVLDDLRLIRVVEVTGIVSRPDESPLQDVEVSLYRWTDGGLETVDEVPTDEDGVYRLSVRPGDSRYTLLFTPGPSYPDLAPLWLDGGTDFPTSPDGPGFFTVDGTVDPLKRNMEMVPPPPPVDPDPDPEPEPNPGPQPPAEPKPSPTATPSPTPTASPAPPVAKAKAVVRLKVSPKKLRRTGKVIVKVTVKVAAGGSTAGRLQLTAGTRVLARKSVSDGSTRTITWKLTAKKLRAKKLKPGKHRLRAVFSGNATTLGASSGKVTLRLVTR